MATSEELLFLFLAGGGAPMVDAAGLDAVGSLESPSSE